MTITLTIDSVDSLPDGGPVSYRARNRGFEIGRQQHLDWTLPDPSRFISGLHCDVRFEKGGYYLYDVSSNGTFLNGSTSRMKSPHRLTNGDRLTIGQYIVLVEVEGEEQPAPARRAEPQPSFASPSPPAFSDIWDTGAPAQAPIARRDLMPEPAGRSRAADYSNQFIEFPDVRPTPETHPFQADPLVAAPVPTPRRAEEAPFQPQAAPIPRPAPRPAPIEASQPPRGDAAPYGFGQPAASVPPVPSPYASAAGGMSAAQARFLEGLAAGAGVSPETFLARDPGEIGYEVGEFMKMTVEHLAQLLRARAAAKAMTKSSSRTMIGATDNNPLKFIPSASEAIDVMFTRKRPGYLTAKGSLDAAFGDLKRHELATWTAMQKALSRLLDDFSPDTITAKVGNSLLSSKSSRSWEVFVERWEAKSEPHENGLLDVFLGYFAEAYDEANKKT